MATNYNAKLSFDVDAILNAPNRAALEAINSRSWYSRVTRQAWLNRRLRSSRLKLSAMRTGHEVTHLIQAIRWLQIV